MVEKILSHANDLHFSVFVIALALLHSCSKSEVGQFFFNGEGKSLSHFVFSNHNSQCE